MSEMQDLYRVRESEEAIRPYLAVLVIENAKRYQVAELIDFAIELGILNEAETVIIENPDDEDRSLLQPICRRKLD